MPAASNDASSRRHSPASSSIGTTSYSNPFHPAVVDDLCHQIQGLDLSSHSTSTANSGFRTGSSSRAAMDASLNPLADLDYVLGKTDRPGNPHQLNAEYLSAIEEQTESSYASSSKRLQPVPQDPAQQQQPYSSPGSAASSNSTIRGAQMEHGNTSRISSFSDHSDPVSDLVSDLVLSPCQDPPRLTHQAISPLHSDRLISKRASNGANKSDKAAMRHDSNPTSPNRDHGRNLFGNGDRPPLIKSVNSPLAHKSTPSIPSVSVPFRSSAPPRATSRSSALSSTTDIPLLPALPKKTLDNLPPYKSSRISSPPMWSSTAVHDICVPQAREFGSLSSWRSNAALASSMFETDMNSSLDFQRHHELNHGRYRAYLPKPSSPFSKNDDRDDEPSYIHGLTSIGDSSSPSGSDEGNDIIDPGTSFIDTSPREHVLSMKLTSLPTPTTSPAKTAFGNSTSSAMPLTTSLRPVPMTPVRISANTLLGVQEEGSMTIKRGAIHQKLVDVTTPAPFHDALLSLENISGFQSMQFTSSTPQRPSVIDDQNRRAAVSTEMSETESTPRPNIPKFDYIPLTTSNCWTPASMDNDFVDSTLGSEDDNRITLRVDTTPQRSTPAAPVSSLNTRRVLSPDSPHFQPQSPTHSFFAPSQLHPSLSAALLKQAHIRSLHEPLPFTNLDISDCGIESMESLDALLPALTSLSAGCNRLAFLEGVPTSVRTLVVPSNRLAPVTSFHHLTYSLHSLDIRNNHMDDLFPLKCLVNLQVLIADNNGIRSWEKVPSMPTLRTLSLRGNMISCIDGTYSKMPVLEELDMTSNAVSVINDLDMGMSALRKLVLDDNAIQGPMPGTHFNISHLSVRDNMVDSINARSWPCLQHLELQGNAIRQINLENLDHISYVGLACQEHMVPAKMKRGTRDVFLQEDLGTRPFNPIDGEHNEAISARLLAAPYDGENQTEDTGFDYSDLQCVSRLVLDGNTVPPLEQFINMYQLVNLSLVGCGLGSLPARLSRHAPSLRVLDLSQNCIQDVTPLAKLHRLRWLSLKGNDVADYFHAVGYLGHLTRLEFLDLRQNPLTGLFYPNVVVSNPESVSDSDWQGLDFEYQKSLNDSTVVKRTCYRTSLIFHLRTSLRVLDRLSISDDERMEVPAKYTRMERSLAAIMGRSNSAGRSGTSPPPSRTPPSHHIDPQAHNNNLGAAFHHDSTKMSPTDLNRGPRPIDPEPSTNANPPIEPIRNPSPNAAIPSHQHPTHHQPILPIPSASSSPFNANAPINVDDSPIQMASWMHQYVDLTSETEILHEIHLLARKSISTAADLHSHPRVLPTFQGAGFLPRVIPSPTSNIGPAHSPYISPAMTVIGPDA